MDITPSQTLYINNLNEKIKKDVLKKTLYAVFSQFGRVIEIVACKGIKLRGQAWVVYQDVTAATNAMRRLQGFNFYDKPLKIAFSKNKSDVVARKNGEVVPVRQKRQREEQSKPMEDGSETPAAAVAPKPAQPKLVVNSVPNRILFAQNLPEECTDQVLSSLCQSYPGFQEVRMVPGKKGIAFIEFQDQMQAGIAMQQLNGFKLNANDTLHLTYAKQ
mmetsp:Transcript_33740/g.34369  ORF Transcript_33740/g.34369 Transcript_33740/m.34369 type:complete len:217 (+) Transcript_33740:101-751(+)|eukprot:CAMPEP_0182428492 /NCGR_PEP_ID=MMETSP1167-20130531/23063_1 /TAXON_ID=2988 /ORGANISM="Mallomonas Sp, Strain CCMP3275" /LENGTH=216 /DNA_ID=CAMNT_0024611429 /DNA_START=100 /DNA_END=750 /DNA_ORIENTATION=+